MVLIADLGKYHKPFRSETKKFVYNTCTQLRVAKSTKLSLEKIVILYLRRIIKKFVLIICELLVKGVGNQSHQSFERVSSEVGKLQGRSL